MSKIISIGTAVPAHKHRQSDILNFMQQVYAMNEPEKRKMRFLYQQSGIETRYSVVPDYNKISQEWKFYPHSENLEPFPSLELRMIWYQKYAATLSVDAIRHCLTDNIATNDITHLITVSCTGMSAPGLDLQVMELLDLPKNTNRTSINFMGCYAAIHAMKIADAVCKSDENAKVLIVCTELCTLHFQKESTNDNIASSLLFADGSAAMLITADSFNKKGIHIDRFYAEVLPKGKKDMAWELSSTGFLMTLSGYVPDLIKEDFESLVNRALQHAGITKNEISNWCIHPGGKRILDAIASTLHLPENSLQNSYAVMREFGNMSSPTILFVLQRILQQGITNGKVFGAAFGPGLTMETFVLSQQKN